VGFYGGINYGFGYGGVGFVGGEWRSGVFAYNTAVTNVNTTVIHNTYNNTTVINKTTVVNNVSYNGGTGGTTVRPTVAEQTSARESHSAPTALQMQHEHAASQNHALLATANHGRPTIAATSRPGEFTGHGVTAAHPANANANRSPNTVNTANRGDRPPSASSRSQSVNASQNRNPHGPNGERADDAHVGNPHPNNPQQNNSRPTHNHPENHPNNEHPSGGHERPGR
jgi:hypothetical protein